MSPGVVLVSLLSLVLVYSAAGLECRIYVSSSHGINNTSCWTGGIQTPCATIDLAIQGTATLQYNCSSGILINLSPGTYTLDTTSLLEQQLLRNNVSIIGMRDGSRYEEVSITCLHVSSSSYNWLRYIVFECVSLYNCNNVPVTCAEPSFDITTHNEPVLGYEICLDLQLDFIDTDLSCSDYYQYNSNCRCEYLSFTAMVIDPSTNKKFDWNYEFDVRISINSSVDHKIYSISKSSCFDPEEPCYQINKCFSEYIGFGPVKVSLYIQSFKVTINKTLYVTATCESEDSNCTLDLPTCDMGKPSYELPYRNNFLNYNENSNDPCIDNTTGECYVDCALKGVPFNNFKTCVECDKYGLLVFIAIEILPITIMVLLIIILNIQLTKGSINGVVFYSQIMTISFPVYHYYNFLINIPLISPTEVPCNIFNLDFTQFIYNYFMCISPNTSPLGAISFWYVIGFYPLLLLLLLYVWITLYDKGYKCVIFITRPFHRCMARFWSMTGIEPSFTHSIASIYILCFTQLAATSFKLLSFDANSTSSFNDTKFYYDIKQNYFDVKHGAAGFFAILVLLFLIVLPTLYILFYPFKWFHKLFDCLHLRKQLLISLGDVFTGPYKNGTENTYDYRFMAGLYLLARIIILSQFIYGYYSIISIPISQACCSFLLAVIVIIFRPFQRNVHNFAEFLILFVTTIFGCTSTVNSILISKSVKSDIVFVIILNIFLFLPLIINGLIFVIIIPGYIIYQVYKMIKSCYRYHKRNNPVANRNQEEDHQPLVGNDDDWIADRMENPQEYDEQHVPGRMDDVSEEDQQPAFTRYIATAATYGSINEDTHRN
uniref:TRP C-terminal domain-containing protein n=2 Tax=Amphimedon queenslandica TaxID=400682 RepID=A0A1X7TVY8_AMPQE